MMMTRTFDTRLRPIQQGSLPGDGLCVAWREETRQAFVGGTQGQIFEIALDREKWEPQPWGAHITYVSALKVVGNQLVSVGSDHEMCWWDLESHTRVRQVTHPKWIRYVAASHDLALLATVCDDMIARLWETETGKLVREFHGHATHTDYGLPSKLYSCAFSPDGKQLATVDQIGGIQVWDVTSGRSLAAIRAANFFTHDTNGHGYGGIRGVVFSPDGKWVALCGNQAGDTSQIAGSKSLIHVYDWQTAQRVVEFTDGGNFFYERLGYHPTGDWLLAAGGAGADPKLAFFDVEQKQLLHTQASPLLVFDMQLSRAADALLTVGRKEKAGHVVLWHLEPEERPPEPLPRNVPTRSAP